MRRLLLLLGIVALSAGLSANFTIPNANAVSYARQAVAMESDYAALVAGIAGQGVTSGCAVTAQTPLSFSLDVASCQAVINGLAVTSGSGSVTIAAPNTTPRIDLVVMDDGGIFDVVQGAPGVTPYTADLPSDAVLLAAVYVPANANTITNVNLTDKRVFINQTDPSPLLPYEVDVTSYGAVCDGTTDDTTAIQAAFDAALAMSGHAAVVIFPAQNRCKVTSTITDGSATPGTDSYISIKGVSAAVSGLRWAGATNGTALKLARVKYFAIEHFGLVNAGAKGTTTGLLEGGNSAGYGGTQTLAGTLTDVLVSGFNVGIKAGDAGVQAAASEILYQTVTLTGNTTGFLGNDLNSLDHTFVNLSADTNDTTLNFSASSNGTVLGGSFSNSTTADVVVSQNGTFYLSGIRSELANRFLTSTSSSHVVIDSVLAVSPTNVDRIAITGSFSRLDVRGSKFDGAINLTGGGTLPSVSIATSTVYSTQPVPFSYAGVVRYTVDQVNFHDANGVFPDRWFPNESGTTGEYVPAGSAITTTWPLEQTQIGVTGNPNAADGLSLLRVRTLGEGTRVPGKNLRLQTTLGAGATTAVSFIRTVTVSIDQGRLTATSGRFFPADVGKRATVTLGGSFGTAIGFLDTYTDATHAVFAPNNAFMFCCNSQTGQTLTIGEDEPDANYIPVATCQTGLAIGIDSLSTTGFTLVPSAPSLGNQCNVAIYR